MNSFGHVAGEAASLLLSGSCTPPHPWPPPSSFRIRSHREGKFFIGVMKPSSTPNPNSVDLGPGRPEIPQQVSKPSLSHLPRPLARWLEKAGNKTYGGASPGDLVLSITSPGRMVGWPSYTGSPSSPAAPTNRSGKARWQLRWGARIKKHGKLSDVSPPAPIMKSMISSCKISQSLRFAGPG